MIKLKVLHIIDDRKEINGGPPVILNSIYNNFKKNKKLSNVKIFSFKKEINKDFFLNFDLIHFHGIWDYRYLSIMNFAKKNCIPYVLTIHGMLDKWSLKQSFFFKRIYIYIFLKIFLRAAAANHFNNLLEYEDSLKLCKRNFIIENGVDNYIKKISNISNDGIKCLYFGRIHKKKGIELIIRAIHLFIVKTRKKICLNVYGPVDEKNISYFKKLRELVDNLNLNEHVFFHKPVFNLKTKIKIFRDHDIFILSSYQEADSVACKESIAKGLPIIVSKNCKIDKMVKDNRCGFILDSLTSTNLYQKIKLFSKLTKKQRISLKKNCIRTAKNFLNKNIVKRYNRIYNDIYLSQMNSKDWVNKN